MNPNYLSRNELLYELGVRGIACTEDIESLRSTFRAIYLRDFPLEQKYFESASVGDWIAGLEANICELQDFVGKLDSQPVLSTSRILTQVLHLRGRITHLENARICVGETVREKLCMLRQRVDVIEQLGKMATQAEQSTRDQSRTPDQDMEGSSQRDEVRFPSNVVPMLFSSDRYQKIENPLNHLLSQVSVVDGNDIDVLCVFLLKALNIINIAKISPPQIYEMLMPRCRGELLECLQQALATGEPFDSFHARVIQRFIPHRVLLRLRLQVYDRAQRKEETLASYIQSIKDAAAYLRIPEDEQQIVARVVAGLHPTQKVKFCFQSLPTTFVHLEQLVVLDRVEMYEEKVREDDMSSGVGSVSSSETSVPTRARFSNSRSYQMQNQQKSCFRCSRPGHLSRHCHMGSQRRM
jgi:hypothetical protein